MRNILVLFVLVTFLSSCGEDIDTSKSDYKPTPVTLEMPAVFKDRILPPIIPVDNPLTKEGIALGKKLFYDPILSGDGSQSCAGCHNQANAFAENRRFSIGIDKIQGTRNAMPIFNLAFNYQEKFFWDGRAFDIENQAEGPVENPIEMHNIWDKAVESLQNSKTYPELFRKAFGTDKITKELTVKAIAQFERTIVSANSKFDRFLLGQEELTFDERMGYQIFQAENKGDCFHCHGSIENPLWTDNSFHNNGMDSVFTDIGLEEVTGNPGDRGRFKTPSLRNLKFSAPYMHDGRFATLDEVINHYSEGLVFSPSIDPLMKSAYKGGVHLTEKEKGQLKAFLLSLSDDSFVTNPEYSR